MGKKKAEEMRQQKQVFIDGAVRLGQSSIKAEEILGLRLITLHNLHFYLNLMAEMRSALEAGTFAAFRREFVGGYRPHQQD